jgi:nucleoside triphosphate diphosphatase
MSADLKALRTLLEVMARLRDPKGGCPWDLEQTFATIAPYTIEEAYEVADAIDSGKPEKLRDELGDLLFQVVFHARMAQEKGWFDFDGVADAIASKLIRRHPHVFGDERITHSEELHRLWEDQKERERREVAGERGDAVSQVLADVPRGLPALTRAAKLGKRAARVGFDWPDAKGVRDKITEELAEVDEAVSLKVAQETRVDEATREPTAAAMNEAPGASSEIAEELGDLLFAVVNWARHLKVDPENALRSANTKFERRFTQMEQLAQARGLELKTLSAAEWDSLWNEAKARGQQ